MGALVKNQWKNNISTNILLIFILVICVVSGNLSAQCRTDANTQNWSTTTWTGCTGGSGNPINNGGTYPSLVNVNNLTAGETLSFDINFTFDNSVTFTSSGTNNNPAVLIIKSGKTFNVSGKLTLQNYTKIIVEEGATLDIDNQLLALDNFTFEIYGTARVTKLTMGDNSRIFVGSEGSLSVDNTISGGTSSIVEGPGSIQASTIDYESASCGSTCPAIFAWNCRGASFCPSVCSPISGTVSGTSTKCPGSTSGPLRVTGSFSSVVRWESSTDGGKSWVNITTTSNPYTSGALYETTLFRAYIKGSGNCYRYSSSATITINSSPKITITASSNPVCSGGVVTFTSGISNSGTSPSFQWTKNGVNILGATGSSYSTSTISSGDIFGCKFTSTISSCGAVTIPSNSIIMSVTSTNTWSGAVSNNWSVAGNWCGGVPTSSHDVVIPQSASRMPVISSYAVCRNISIENNASLSVGSANLIVGGLATLEGTLNLNSPSSLVTFNGDFIFNGTWSSVTFSTATFNAEAKFLKSLETSANFTINGTLVFPASGKITVNEGAILKMGQSATYQNAGIHSFVIGRMQKTVASVSRFIFPIGRDTLYRPIGIDPQTKAVTTFEAEYFKGNPPPKSISDEPGIPVVSGIEYWDLKKVTGANVKVTLYWGESSKVSEDGELEFLRVAHYNTVGGFWENKGYGASTGTWRTGSVTSEDYQSNFSPYTIASSTMIHPLPVHLLNFYAKRENTKNILSWEAISEENNSGFEIQRSLDGFKTFKLLGFVKAALLDSGIQTYSFIDSESLQSGVYYRLKQIDANGDFRFSIVKYLEPVKEKPSVTRLFPNPTTGDVVLIVEEHELAKFITYQIISSQGVLKVSKKAVKNDLISESLSYDINHLNSGVYNIILSNGSKIHRFKLIKN